MKLKIAAHGRSCDLALHPVSEKTAKKIEECGSKVYSMKMMNWWRKGKTTTWGMKIDSDCALQVTLDDKPVKFDFSSITKSPVKIRRRLFLESNAKYLAVLGFDNEICRFTWEWDNIKEFDPQKFDFMVHQWDRIMGEDNYFILDDARYEGKFADRNDWCEAQGFTLVPPKVIDLSKVRQEFMQNGELEHQGNPFPTLTEETMRA
ncbi:hypothetical protein [Maridesulfovibrio sp.]|uniref:hypothetical protein n=1 Tax=Maridesulfovibrio sp. TaxID=2795000 RepID=UPI002A18E613|nr:hypothetical protein [Maridesulfovibrio sp.]